MNYNALEKLEDFVFECLLQYSEEGIINDSSQEWNICHHPKPSCLGGNETTQLLKQHHAIHGVLQSEAFNHPCIFSWERKYLTETEHIELFDKWISEKARSAGEASHAEKNDKNQSVRAVKIGKIGAAVVHAEQNEDGLSLHTLKLHEDKNEEGKSVFAAKGGEGNAKKTRKAVLLTELKTDKTYTFCSIIEAARQLNLSRANLSSLLNGQRKSVGGFTAVFI